MEYWYTVHNSIGILLSLNRYFLKFKSQLPSGKNPVSRGTLQTYVHEMDTKHTQINEIKQDVVP